MSQQNKEENDEGVVLPLHHYEDLKKLDNDLLQHEINFCRNSISLYPSKYVKAMQARLRAAEEEAERRFLLS